MVYAIVSLILLVLFLAGTALPFFMAYGIGRFAGQKLGFTSFRWMLPLALLATIAAWVVGSYTEFERACRSAPKPVYFFSPTTRPVGITIRSEGDWRSFTRGVFGARQAIAKGFILFVDDPNFGRSCAGEKQHASEKILPIQTKCEKYASVKSSFTVYMFKEKQVEYWWNPPIFVAEVQITENATGKVAASATDIVFGGGILGTYMMAFGRDQDFERLSCGHASREIGLWRPSLSTRERQVQYDSADLNFLVRALGLETKN